MYPVELIPNEDRLFRRVHKNLVRDGKLTPAAFKQIGDGMSVDWERYSTVQETVGRAKNPGENGVVSVVCGDLRNLGLEVVHAPSRDNRSYSNVRGKIPIQHDRKVQFKLLEMAKLEITVGE
jgi:hypothetical protein